MPKLRPRVCLHCNGGFLGGPQRKYCSMTCYVTATKGKRGTHRASGHPLYGTWRAMVKRCRVDHPAYASWFGRGITVWEGWQSDPWPFIRWAEKNGWRPGLEIDRINNDGNYTPENCRFVTDKEQANNRRPRQLTEKGRQAIRDAVIASNRRRAKHNKKQEF